MVSSAIKYKGVNGVPITLRLWFSSREITANPTQQVSKSERHKENEERSKLSCGNAGAIGRHQAQNRNRERRQVKQRSRVSCWPANAITISTKAMRGCFHI